MVQEVGRRLVGGVWVTNVEDESGGGSVDAADVSVSPTVAGESNVQDALEALESGGSQTVRWRGPFTVTEAAVLAAWDTDHADIDGICELEDGESIILTYSFTTANWTTEQPGYGYLDVFEAQIGGNVNPCVVTFQAPPAVDSPVRAKVGVSADTSNKFIIVGARSLGLRYFQEPAGATGSGDIYLLTALPS